MSGSSAPKGASVSEARGSVQGGPSGSPRSQPGTTDDYVQPAPTTSAAGSKGQSGSGAGFPGAQEVQAFSIASPLTGLQPQSGNLGPTAIGSWGDPDVFADARKGLFDWVESGRQQLVNGVATELQKVQEQGFNFVEQLVKTVQSYAPAVDHSKTGSLDAAQEPIPSTKVSLPPETTPTLTNGTLAADEEGSWTKFGRVLGEIINSKRTPQQKVDAFRQLAVELEVESDGDWQAKEYRGANGSTVFVGLSGEVLVFDAEGKLFRGHASQLKKGSGGVRIPDWEALRELSPGDQSKGAALASSSANMTRSQEGGGLEETFVGWFKPATAGSDAYRAKVQELVSEGGTGAEKAQQFRDFVAGLKQSGSVWTTEELKATDGANVFVGPERQLLVFDKAGMLYRGIDTPQFVTHNSDGTVTPKWENLFRLGPPTSEPPN